MTTNHRNRATRLARTTVRAAAAVAAVVLPLGAGVAHAAQAAGPEGALPPGVVKLNDGEPCPSATLCLYRDYGNQGPAYGIGAGYNVDLKQLPMEGGNGSSAANNVSSWVNNTGSVGLLIDEDGPTRPLFPSQQLQEPPQFNDTVDLVAWPS
ncbi:peptidase inhibitor family I36 protein [Streptomyces daliensis]|uniref:Peptidase inhibitor family I36 protein n=1 Tax=Streptomyces daliensis TaxID=299421 RepID=A0A8T4J2X5_9ACTN|nr:peptidase inhibitor family I36 protein [Streptomyces daliensis]